MAAARGGGTDEALIAELGAAPAGDGAARRAQVAALLRFAGGPRIVAGRVVVAATLDHEAVARRLAADIAALYGRAATVRALPGGRIERPRYVVEVNDGGAVLARQVGLVDPAGRWVRGLPMWLVGGQRAPEAVWRGAFLASGRLGARGRSCEVGCPSVEAAVALVGAARRLGVRAKARQAGGVDSVTVAGADVVTLLARMGAHNASAELGRQHARSAVRRTGNFSAANQARSAQAAADTAAQARRALDILGDTAPQHLVAAAMLRIEHPDAPLQQLGRLADPPVSKDTISGQIRRLLRLAERRLVEHQAETDLTVDRKGARRGA